MDALNYQINRYAVQLNAFRTKVKLERVQQVATTQVWHGLQGNLLAALQQPAGCPAAISIHTAVSATNRSQSNSRAQSRHRRRPDNNTLKATAGCQACVSSSDVCVHHIIPEAANPATTSAVTAGLKAGTTAGCYPLLLLLFHGVQAWTPLNGPWARAHRTQLAVKHLGFSCNACIHQIS